MIVIFLEINLVLLKASDQFAFGGIPGRLENRYIKEGIPREKFDFSTKACNAEMVKIFDKSALANLDSLILSIEKSKESVGIVISSDWRNNRSISELKDLFKQHSFSNKIIDKTIDQEFSPFYHRGEEIELWLKENREKLNISNFVVIDELDSGIKERFKRNFIQTNAEFFDKNNLKQAIEVLRLEPTLEKKFENYSENKGESSVLVSKKMEDILSHTAFLIEGFSDTSRFPEIAAAIELAKANKCEYFDSISSFDVEHITTLLKNKSEKVQKSIVLCIYLLFATELNPEDIIHLLKEPFIRMESTEVIHKIPTWVEQIRSYTIDLFAKHVLDEIFEGQVEKFKEFNKNFQKEEIQVSNLISSKRFLEYISNRNSLKTIYALVGKNHLEMLDSIGTPLKKDDNYKIVKIQTGDRIIEVHLYGGSHGDMTHYEKLAEHAKKQGLTIPALPSKKEENIDELIKLLLVAFKSSSRRPDMFSESRSRSADSTVEEKKEILSISQSADKFDKWMKMYLNHNGSHNEKLVDWLSMDSGAKHVQDYKQFCELADALQKKGYQTIPPPNESDFKRGITEYNIRKAEKIFRF